MTTINLRYAMFLLLVVSFAMAIAGCDLPVMEPSGGM